MSKVFLSIYQAVIISWFSQFEKNLKNDLRKDLSPKAARELDFEREGPEIGFEGAVIQHFCVVSKNVNKTAIRSEIWVYKVDFHDGSGNISNTFCTKNPMKSKICEYNYFFQRGSHGKFFDPIRTKDFKNICNSSIARFLTKIDGMQPGYKQYFSTFTSLLDLNVAPPTYLKFSFSFPSPKFINI